MTRGVEIPADDVVIDKLIHGPVVVVSACGEGLLLKVQWLETGNDDLLGLENKVPVDGASFARRHLARLAFMKEPSRNTNFGLVCLSYTNDNSLFSDVFQEERTWETEEVLNVA